jgi:DNA primase
MISQQDIDKILEAAKIEEVVGSFIELKKRGANYVACCPFHGEKTPSFYVNPARNIFKCFGCGEGGNSVNFLMKYQHYTYPEALRWLAQKYNIEIHEKELSKEEISQRDEKDSLYHINELACKYYYNNLLESEEGKTIGLSYFAERKISRKTIDTWSLGYAKKKGDDFASYALKEGYREEDLIQSGLCLKSEKDGSLYDRFRGRVTFPIYNVGGRVLGFSARILTSDKTKAKYVNSPESPIYTKGKTLFGLNFARTEIAKKDLCYLVEGNVDAIMMYQNEVKNVVASSGTALTESQVRMIKRYTTNVAILYDGDAAGIHAAIRATDMFFKEGMHISIILFPDGDDPDSFARKHTQDEFQQFLKDNAQNFILYRTNLALEENLQKDPIKKATFVREIIHSISLIPDALERSTYIEQCAAMLNMREEVLIDQLNKEIVHNAFQSQKEASKQSPSDTPTMQDQNATTDNTSATPIQEEISLKEETLERNLLRILVNYASITTNQEVLIDNKIEIRAFNAGVFILNDIIGSEIAFLNPLYKKVIDRYIEYYKANNSVLSADDLMKENDAEVNSLLSALLMENDRISISKNWEKFGVSIPDINSPKVIDADIKYTTLSAKLNKLSLIMEDLKQQMQKNPSDDSLIDNFYSLTLLRNNLAQELNRSVF